MKFIGRFLIGFWAGALPSIIGGFTLNDWQTWLSIVGTAILLAIHEACLKKDYNKIGG